MSPLFLSFFFFLLARAVQCCCESLERCVQAPLPCEGRLEMVVQGTLCDKAAATAVVVVAAAGGGGKTLAEGVDGSHEAPRPVELPWRPLPRQEL